MRENERSVAAVVEVGVTFTEKCNFSPGCAGKPPKPHLIKSVVKELKNTSTSKNYKQKFVFKVFAVRVLYMHLHFQQSCF